MKPNVLARSQFAPALIAFIGGLLVGVAWERLPVRGEPARPPPATHRSDPMAEARAPDSAALTQTANVSATRERPEPAPEHPQHLAQLRTLSRLNQSLRFKFHVPFLMGEDLNEDFVRLFRLSNSEAKMLNDAISRVRTRMTEIEGEKATILRTTDGGFAITIPEFPAEGGAVYDDFMHTIRETLGPQRLQFCEQLSSVDFTRSSAFRMFGLCESDIRVTPTRDEQGRPTSHWLTNLDGDTGGMSRSITIDPSLLEAQFPSIYQRMRREGLLAPGP